MVINWVIFILNTGRVKVTINVFDHEVIIAGIITWYAVFGDGHNIRTKRYMVELFPDEPLAISFQFPQPVNSNTCSISHVSETVLEIAVEKLSISLAREAPLVDKTLIEREGFHKSYLSS